MVLYVDNESKVRAVNSTVDASLTPLYVDETANLFPFKGWSTAKICCYKVSVEKGMVIMYTPYVDSRMIDQIDLMGHSIENAEPFVAVETAFVGATEVVFVGVPNGVISVDAKDCEDNPLSYNVSKTDDIVRVFFDEPLKYAADIRILVN